MNRTLVLALVLPASACVRTDNACKPPPSSPALTARDESQVRPFALTGSWRRELENEERYLFHFFASGIVGFQHVGPKLPIASSFGRWSMTGRVLELTMHDDRPEVPFPLATRFIAAVDRRQPIR